MKSILITGATGFIGSHLLFSLSLCKFNITLALRRFSLSSNSQDYYFVNVGEINENTNWQDSLNNIDIVIHLAARAHQLKDQANDPEAEFQKINHHGTANLVQQAIKAGVKHFIFMSSIGAVTTLSKGIISEQTPCHPDTSYGRSKLDAEKALTQLCHGTAMSWTILRPTLVYGPNNPGNMERLLALVNKNFPLPLGSVNNARSLLYVGNLVDAIITCLDHPNAKNQTFIVSDGQDLSTPKLICHLGQALGKPAKLLPFPPALLKLAASTIGKADVAERLLGSLQVDCSKIRETLHWAPPYTVEEGLKITANWFKTRRSPMS